MYRQTPKIRTDMRKIANKAMMLIEATKVGKCMRVYLSDGMSNNHFP